MIKNISSIIDIGENIEIEVNYSDNSSIVMKSDIVEVSSNDIIIISSPIYKGNIYPIHPGDKFKIMFYKENVGKHYFIGEVLKREKRRHLNIIHVKCTSKIRRTQRRSFFRLNILLNIDIIVSNNNNEKSTINCLAKDISGGGLRLISKERIPYGAAVKCIIPLDGQEICATGIIVRCEPVPESIIKYDVGVEFSSLDESIRSKIISFIFDKQRNLIKKGLI